MLQPDTWNILLAGSGSILGLFIGAYLSRSWDRNKWLNDNRKSEYKELLTAITTASVSIIKSASEADDFDVRKQANEANTEFHRVVNDRIFIASELEEIKIVQRWDEAVNMLLKTVDKRQSKENAAFHITSYSVNAADLVAQFEVEFSSIRKIVISAATNVAPMWSDIAAFFDKIQNMADKP